MDGKEYIGTSRTAEMLHLTSRRVAGLCREGKLAGAVFDGRKWMIPEASVRACMTSAGIKESLLPCAVGNTSYIETSSECYYVDKTLLIRDLIDDHNMVTLFTRPRKFGKTLAVNMLRTFFEKSDKDTSKYFTDKKIWACGPKYQAQQGKYPVIMLTFKDVRYDSWQDTLEAICLVIKDEYRRHSELMESSLLGADDKDYLARMKKGTLSSVEYSRSLLNLTRMLAAHYRENVVILIDEYDTPIRHGSTRGFYRDVLTFMRNFLSGGLKDNPDLAFGVMTGILCVSKENLFSGLNNLTVNTVLDEKYSSFFGFTGEEVQSMAEYYGKPDCMKEIQEWYDGYRIGNSKIYNPWSVTSYFSGGGRPKAFWAETSDNEIIREVLEEPVMEASDDLTRLMQGDEIHTALNMEAVYPGTIDGTDMIFSFLLLAGYLTLSSAPEETEFGTFAALKVPNMEIRRVYNMKVLGWMRTQPAGVVIQEMEKAVCLGDGNRLKKALRIYMIACISASDETEAFYHGMMLGLAASLSSRYYIHANGGIGDGRFDIRMEPKEKQLPGIIMEFKAAPPDSKRKNLAAMADDAIAQIERQQYMKELEAHGIRKIVKYGIAFSEKAVEVKMAE